MKTVRLTGFVTKRLVAAGFSPRVENNRKEAGVWRNWTHADGRIVTIGYGLLSRTGQSSRGSAAVWGWTLVMKTAEEQKCAA